VRPKRSLLFVWHTAEEKGLYGAQYYSDHPTVPRDSIVAQVNMDQMGRGGREDAPPGGADALVVIGSRRLSTELGDLAERVNARGIDCVGGTMMNIARHLDSVGLSGADCAAGMMDGYTELLEHVGLDQRAALRNVAGIFAPLMAKYRRGERTK